MEPYSHKSKFTLRYSDFDFKDEILPSALLSLVQEAACRSADELGFGYDDLKPLGFGFLVVNTFCKFNRPVRLGDDLVIETWPMPPRHVIFEREYRVWDGKGELLASLASRWCLVDMERFTLLTPDAMREVHERCPYRNEKAVEVPSWKLPRVREGRKVYETEVRAAQCDHYLHANNARYADFFFDCFGLDELSARPVLDFQIVYGKQAKAGKELVLFREDEGNVSLCEAVSDGELIAQFRVTFGEKEGK